MFMLGLGRHAVNHVPAMMQRQRLAMAAQSTIVDNGLQIRQRHCPFVIMDSGGTVDCIGMGVMHTR